MKRIFLANEICHVSSLCRIFCQTQCLETMANFLSFPSGVRTDVYWQDSSQARAGAKLLFQASRNGGSHEDKDSRTHQHWTESWSKNLNKTLSSLEDLIRIGESIVTSSSLTLCTYTIILMYICKK